MAKSAAQQKGVSPETAFGRALKEFRQRRELSQDELGARSGYHRTYIGQLERGQKSPSLRTIFNLAGTLEISPSVLVRETEKIVGSR